MPTETKTDEHSRVRRLFTQGRRASSAGLFVVLAAAASVFSNASEASPEGYGLQPGDVIWVSVWREEGLEQGVLVRPDGGISFPLAGDLSAEGRTVEEVTNAIAEKLSKYIPNPVVTVSLQENRGNAIYVTGRVNKPGVFLIHRDIDVMQALAMAAGLTPFADKDDIKVLRRDKGVQRSISFNYKDVQKGRMLEQNIILQPGDTVVVP